MDRRITEVELHKYGFDPARLRHEGGFDEFKLKEACFDAEDLRKGKVISKY